MPCDRKQLMRTMVTAMYEARTLKALFEVRLHALRVLCLRQDLQHLVVGQEEEPARGAVHCLLFAIMVPTGFEALKPCEQVHCA